jgi:uncharacterized membrane-anchored protein YitT (DUF2179 family)
MMNLSGKGWKNPRKAPDMGGSESGGNKRGGTRLFKLSPEEFRVKQRAWRERTTTALPGIAKSYAMIALGCLIMAAGYSFFLIPMRIAPGGVYGIATVLHYITASMLDNALPTGMLGLVMNIPLFIWGLKALGARFASRTVFGMIMASVFMDLLTYLIPHFGMGPQIESLNIMLASIFGGLLIGIGLGVIFRYMGSTGGTDIVGQILGRKTNISVGVWMMIVDAIVVLMAVFYFKDINLSLYAGVTIFVTGKVIDTVLEGQSRARSLMIITENLESIREAILFGLLRTGTVFEGQGLYRGKQKQIVLCVVDRKNLIHLERLVAEADPNAFIVVNQAHEVLGEGFMPLRERLSQEGQGI